MMCLSYELEMRHKDGVWDGVDMSLPVDEVIRRAARLQAWFR